MQNEPNTALVALYWVVVVYRYLLFAWVLLTWIPGISGSTFHHILGLPVEPVLRLFWFLDTGPVGFSPLAVFGILWLIENWIKKRIEPEQDIVAAAQPESDRTNS